MNSIVNESTTQRQGGEGGPTNPASPSDVVAALRRHEWVRIMQEAADLIESQERRIKELVQQRDELLAAAEKAAKVLRQYATECDGDTEDAEELEAAIAKVKP